MVGGVGLPVDAVGVDLEQDGDAVPGAAGGLGRGYPGVEPQRDRRVAQVVGSAAKRGTLLGGGQGLLAGLGPDLVVAGVLEKAAPGGLEDPPVRGGAVPLDVGAEQADEFGRDRDGPRLVVGAVLQATFLPRGAVGSSPSLSSAGAGPPRGE
jgi:hypothetical protein